MQTTDTDLDKVLNYLATKIDFESDTLFQQDKDEITDLLIDLQMNFETLQNVLNFYQIGNYIKDLVINEYGFSFQPWNELYHLWEEGGFEAENLRGQ